MKSKDEATQMLYEHIYPNQSITLAEFSSHVDNESFIDKALQHKWADRRKLRDTITDALEEREESGYQDGHSQGQDDGYNDGLREGEISGYDEGYSEGVSEAEKNRA